MEPEERRGKTGGRCCTALCFAARGAREEKMCDSWQHHSSLEVRTSCSCGRGKCEGGAGCGAWPWRETAVRAQGSCLSHASCTAGGCRRDMSNQYAPSIQAHRPYCGMASRCKEHGRPIAADRGVAACAGGPTLSLPEPRTSVFIKNSSLQFESKRNP